MFSADLGTQSGGSGSAATAVESASAGADADADHESAASAGDEREPVLEGKTVERTRASRIGKASISFLGQPSSARVTGTLGLDESRYRRVNCRRRARSQEATGSGATDVLAGPRLRADHGQTGRNWITSCLPTTPALIPRVWIAGSNQPGVECPLVFSSALVSILRRACTANPAEHPRKVLLRFETAGHGDIQDTCLRRAQHLLRTLYSVA